MLLYLISVHYQLLDGLVEGSIYLNAHLLNEFEDIISSSLSFKLRCRLVWWLSCFTFCHSHSISLCKHWLHCLTSTVLKFHRHLCCNRHFPSYWAKIFPGAGIIASSLLYILPLKLWFPMYSICWINLITLIYFVFTVLELCPFILLSASVLPLSLYIDIFILTIVVFISQ